MSESSASQQLCLSIYLSVICLKATICYLFEGHVCLFLHGNTHWESEDSEGQQHHINRWATALWRGCVALGRSLVPIERCHNAGIRSRLRHCAKSSWAADQCHLQIKAARSGLSLLHSVFVSLLFTHLLTRSLCLCLARLARSLSVT